MDMLDPLQQLSTKRRTYEDLSRFLGARAGASPTYTLLMGAGCSVSSGIRSASALVEEWRRDVFARLCPDAEYSIEVAQRFLSEKHSSWYSPRKEYSSLFEKNFDLPRQRRQFVEREVADKSPNLGYAYLIKLIDTGFLNTTFTTNFDDLLNEAFFQFSKMRPLVCAHDSSVSSVTVTSKRPKIIKLHGDYLFDDIKSTVRETESLEENTRRKFIEFGREFGLIVVGYAGCDRSVMDVLQYLLRSEDYFKHGIYWCIRKGDKPSEDLLKLLWRDRVYFVEIEGFDELMAGLHYDLIGDRLPIDTSIISDKPRLIVKSFCDNEFLRDSPSPYIKRDLEKFQKQNAREQLLNVFRDMRSDDSEDASLSESLGDGELVKLLSIKQLIEAYDLGAARERIIEELAAEPSKRLKEELSELRVTVEELTGDHAAALGAVDELIAEDPQEPENYIRKTFLTPRHHERMDILDAATIVGPFSVRVFNRRLECLIDAYEAAIAFDRAELLECIWENFEKSTRIDPSLRNAVWRIITDFLTVKADLEKSEGRRRLDEISKFCAERNPQSPITLQVRLSRCSKYKDDRKSAAADELLAEISQVKLTQPKTGQPYYQWLELDAFRRLDRRDELSRRISELDVNPEFSSRREFLKRKAEFQLKFNGDIDGAIVSLREAIKVERSATDILRLGYYYRLKRSVTAIADLLAEHKRRLRPLERLTLELAEASAGGDFERALALLRKCEHDKLTGATEKVEETHLLLHLTRYAEAEKISKEVLDKLGWEKLSFGPLIVNYELARLRQNQGVSKKRLSELADATPSDAVKGCCKYLIGDLEKARELLKGEVALDRENGFAFKEWAIFQDEKGRKFFESVMK